MKCVTTLRIYSSAALWKSFAAAALSTLPLLSVIQVYDIQLYEFDKRDSDLSLWVTAKVYSSLFAACVRKHRSTLTLSLAQSRFQQYL